jgi:glycerophosphoryl diester phosphodiesterase
VYAARGASGILAGVSAFPRLFYAHRGAPAELPENTLPSFRRALERGATALETDAHMTADGQIVLSHDATGGRMANDPREIRKCTLDEVRRWDMGWGYVDAHGARPHARQGLTMPLLEELLRACPDVPVNVDAKQLAPDMVPTLVSLLRRLGAAERVRLASFSTRTLRRIRAAGYPGPTGLGRSEVAALRLAPRALLDRVNYRQVAAQIPTHVSLFRLDTADFIARCHDLGVRVDYWTIDDPTEARRLLALGADGIMTDDPARIAPVFRSGGA